MKKELDINIEKLISRIVLEKQNLSELHDKSEKEKSLITIEVLEKQLSLLMKDNNENKKRITVIEGKLKNVEEKISSKEESFLLDETFSFPNASKEKEFNILDASNKEERIKFLKLNKKELSLLENFFKKYLLQKTTVEDFLKKNKKEDYSVTLYEYVFVLAMASTFYSFSWLYFLVLGMYIFLRIALIIYSKNNNKKKDSELNIKTDSIMVEMENLIESFSNDGGLKEEKLNAILKGIGSNLKSEINYTILDSEELSEILIENSSLITRENIFKNIKEIKDLLDTENKNRFSVENGTSLK